MSSVQIVEVGTRDGFQSVGPIIPTPKKIEILRALYTAGIRRVEATSFVSKTAVPQLADAEDILAATDQLEDLDSQVLVPTARQAERAIAAGAKHLVFVLSISERHNMSNVRRSTSESIDEYTAIVQMLPQGSKMRINVATAFDCPYEGRLPQEQTRGVLQQLIDLAPPHEIALCDTTGRVTPDHVSALFEEARTEFGEIQNWAFHAHDTYGLGTANTLAAWNSGVKIFDASIAGLGGCPFAPGATGNVATEDLVWMFQGMGISTGIDIDALVAVARDVAALPGAQTGGRVREAMAQNLITPHRS
jgi:hydroxymethylglutaryl-CoA lyase